MTLARSRPLAASLVAILVIASVAGRAEAGSRRRSRGAPAAAPSSAPKSDEAVTAALATVPAGGTARLPFGTFRVAIVVDRPMTILGDPRGTTIDAAGLGRPAIEIAPGVTDVTIEGVRVVASDVDGVVARAGADRLTLRRIAAERCRGDGVRVIDATTVRIDLATLDRNGGDGLDLRGRDTDARRLTVRENGGAGVRLAGQDAVVSDSTFLGGAEGVVFEGLRGKVFRASFRGTALPAVFAAGADSCEITRCDVRDAATLARTNDGSTYSRITANRVAPTSSDGVVLRGTWQTVEGNTFARVGGTAVVGDGLSLRVLDNEFARADGAGVRLSGMGNTVEGNVLGACGGDAVSVLGDANVVAKNLSREARGAGLVVDGAFNTIVANRVDGAAREGIRVEGDVNIVQDNRLARSGLEGIVVAGGRDNRLLTNSVLACGGRGVADLGVGTTLDRNRID